MIVLARLDRTKRTAVEQAKQQFSRDLTAFDRLLQVRFLPLAERSSHTDSLKTAFLACRRAYKKLEPFAEYYFPATTRLVNGPPLPEIEADEGKIFEPGGLQVIEGLLYPRFEPRRRPELIREVRKLRRELLRYSSFWTDTEMTDAHLFDLLRLQLFRTITLGISGFDTPNCQTAIPEAAVSIETIRRYVAFYQPLDAPGFVALASLFQKTGDYLNRNPVFDKFDRAGFILALANPLSTQLLAHQQQLAIWPFAEVRALRTTARTLFDTNAFDPDFYAPTVALRSNRARVLLGKKLFFDPILSVNANAAGEKRSCASCHQPSRAFTDGLPQNATLSGRKSLPRNTPTLLNAALQNALFYDLRSQTLEHQSSDVIGNPDEMHGSLEEAARALQLNKVYFSAFRQAFPTLQDRIEPVHIQNALAAYERSLISLNSRFDRYMRGEKNKSGKPVLSTEELFGFNLFMGKAKCGTCHFLPLFNGTVPPVFTQTESEVIGVPVQPASKRIDPDWGRYGIFNLAPLKYAFKTPTVRNIGLTGPYMHNGAYRTLEEVIDFYEAGGGRGLGIPLNNQTLAADKLHLTDPEKTALIAFLKALSDAEPR
ncbi:cytochrome c peroxidase [Larkinella ripae]